MVTLLLGAVLFVQGQTVTGLMDEARKLTMNAKHDEAISVYEKGLELAKKEKKQELAEDCLHRLMQCHQHLGKHNEVEKLFFEKETILGFPVSVIGLADFHTDYGISKIRTGDFKKGISLLYKADSLAEAAGSNGIYTKLEMAYAYIQFGKRDEASEKLFTVYKIAKASDDKINAAIALHDVIGINEDRLHEEPYFTYFNEYITSKKNLETAGHGLFFIKEGEAISERVLELLYQKYKEHYSVLLRLPYIYAYMDKLHKDGKLEKAISVGKEELSRRQPNQLPTKIAEIQSKIAEIYFENNQPSKAYEYLRKSSIINNSVRSKDSEQFMDSLKIKFETLEKEKQIAEQELEINKKTNQRNILIASSFLLALLGFGIYYFTKQKAKRNKLIAEKKRRTPTTKNKRTGKNKPPQCP